jgi:hypothetical protein
MVRIQVNTPSLLSLFVYSTQACIHLAGRRRCTCCRWKRCGTAPRGDNVGAGGDAADVQLGVHDHQKNDGDGVEAARVQPYALSTPAADIVQDDGARCSSPPSSPPRTASRTMAMRPPVYNPVPTLLPRPSRRQRHGGCRRAALRTLDSRGGHHPR